jgi:hypothetical protein
MVAMTRTLPLFLLALALCAQTRIVSPVWITGDGAAHAIDATETARWVTVFALPTNSTASCSTSTVAACPVTGNGSTVAVGSRGLPLLPGASYTYPVLPSGQPGYSLAQIYYAAAVGDKLVIMWAK